MKVSDPQFVRAMGALLGPALVDGNLTETLLNGDRIFPSMLAAIRSAKKTVTFETYIYWSGKVGREFADALAERARAGVRVHILVDWLGSQKMDGAMLDEMKSAGVEIHKYHPLHWYTLDRVNNRTHRKLLVVDSLWVSVGSTNFDPRSFKLNDEANLNIHDREFALRQIANFENDLKRAKRVTYEEWIARPWTEKAWEHLWSLFSSQM